MANSFMAGKLRIPDPAPKVEEKPTTKKKLETGKPWIGQASLRELDKRNADRKYVEDNTPEVPNVGKLGEVPKVQNIPPTSQQLKDSNGRSQNETPIAPVRDFHRVSNSINREALEGGMFIRPSCKQVYDALYLLTRGAIQPSRTVQIGRKQLLKKAGLGSDTTLDAALLSLQTVGLLKVEKVFGSQKGNIYEVLLPQEIANHTLATLGTLGTLGSSGQNLPKVPKVESTYGTQGQLIENVDTYDAPNTLFKTEEEKEIDDEPAAAFRAFEEKLNETVRELNQKGIVLSDEQKLAQIAELLSAELKEAAGRTKVVSDPVAFLLTHLRRRLGVRSVNIEPIQDKTSTSTKGTAKPIKQEIHLTDDEIQECPDCEGRLIVYPQGRDKGALVCRHPQLVKAKQELIGKDSKEPEREEKQQ
jgi:hypothetical protein